MKPRARLVRHEFFVDESIASLEPLTRLLFIGLWTLTDREGRSEYKPREIRAQLMSYEEEVKTTDVIQMLAELEKLRLIVRYSVGEMELIWTPNFKKHQSFHRNESPSYLPAPPEDTLTRLLQDPCKDLPGSLPLNNNSNKNRSESRNRSKSREVETIPEIVSQVIDDLNEVLGSKYKSSTGPYKKAILERVAEGYSLEDFQAVHRGQHHEWAHDPKMSQHLTPATLYRPGNFPKYLANATRTKAPQLNDTTKQILETKKRFLAATTEPTDKTELIDD